MQPIRISSTFLLNHFLLIVIICLLSTSCKNSDKNQINTGIDNTNWEILKINVNNQSIWVVFESDTAYYSQVNKQDTTYLRQFGKFRSELSKFVLSKPERDSLLLYSLEVITKPVLSGQSVSDYAGEYVKISLEEGNTSISCEYASISSWPSISPTLNKIYHLTYGKIKKR